MGFVELHLNGFSCFGKRFLYFVLLLATIVSMPLQIALHIGPRGNFFHLMQTNKHCYMMM